MAYIKKFLILKLLRIFDDSFKLDYKAIDKKAFDEWAFRSFDNVGWRSYFAYEDLKILKEMSYGKDRDQYMVLVGRRLQLLYLFDEMNKSIENRKSARDKQIAMEKQGIETS